MLNDLGFGFLWATGFTIVLAMVLTLKNALSRRKQLGMMVATDVLGLLAFSCFLADSIGRRAIFDCTVNTVFVFLYCRRLRIDYKKWKDSDDDDDRKKRRRIWVKNHLPKPVTRTIPVPI